MKNISFKTFTWPNNPSTFNMSYSKRIIQHQYPDIDGGEIEVVGTNPRIITGNGIFFGPKAYSNFIALHKLFYDKKPGNLYHPKYGKFYVVLTRLSTREEPLPNYVEYDYEFTEHTDITFITKPATNSKTSGGSGNSSNSNKTSTKTYIVVSGDSLWKISLKFYGTGTKWKTIADANKKVIKNPNAITPGMKLIIP